MMSIQPETECCLGDVETRTDTESRDGVSSSAVVGYSLQTDHGVTSSIQPCDNIRDNSQTLSSFQSEEAQWDMHPVFVSSHNENNCETSPEKCRPGDDLDEDMNPAEGQSQRDAMKLNQKTLVNEIIKSNDNSKPRTSLQNVSGNEQIFSERSYRGLEPRSNEEETVKNEFKEDFSNFQDLEVECGMNSNKLDNEDIYFEKLKFNCQSKSNEVILSEDEKYDGCEDRSVEVCDDSLRDARCDVVVQNSATHDGSCDEASCCEFRQDTRCQHSQTENDFIEVSLFQQRNCVDLSYFSESITSDNLWNENNSKEVPGYLDDVTQRCDKGNPNLVELVDDLDQNSDERSSDEESEIKRQGESQFHGDHKQFEHSENLANCCTNDSGVDLVDQFELKDKSRFYDDQKYEIDDCNELSHRESLNHSESYNESVISTGSYTEPNCNECIGRNPLYSHKSSHDLISGDHCDDAIATTDQKNITLHKDPNNDYTHQVDPEGDETRHYEPCNDHDELGDDPSQQEEELNLQGHRKHIDVAESLHGLDELGHEAKHQKNPSDFPEFEIIDDPSIKAHNESNDIVNHLEFADDPVQNGDPPEFLGDETILVPVPTSAAAPAVVSTRAKKRKKQKTKLEKQLAKYVGSQDTGRKKKLVPTYSSFKNFLPIPEDEFHPDFTCPVCLDLFHRPHILTPCQHMFCEPCLRKLPTSALGDNTVCPLCRCDIRACTLDIDLHEQLSYYYSVLYNKRARREKKLRTNQKPLPRLSTTPLSQQLIRQLFRSSQSQRRHQTNHLYVVLGMCMSGILSVLYVWANIPIEITVGPIRTAAVSNIWIQAICLFMVLSWIFVRLLQTFAEGTPR